MAEFAIGDRVRATEVCTYPYPLIQVGALATVVEPDKDSAWSLEDGVHVEFDVFPYDFDPETDDGYWKTFPVTREEIEHV